MYPSRWYSSKQSWEKSGPFVGWIHIWGEYPTSNLHVLCGAYLQSIQNMAQEYDFYNILLGVGCWNYSYVFLYVLDRHGTIDIGTFMLLAKLLQSGCYFKHGSNTPTTNPPAFEDAWILSRFEGCSSLNWVIFMSLVVFAPWSMTISYAYFLPAQSILWTTAGLA